MYMHFNSQFCLVFIIFGLRRQVGMWVRQIFERIDKRIIFVMAKIISSARMNVGMVFYGSQMQQRIMHIKVSAIEAAINIASRHLFIFMYTNFLTKRLQILFINNNTMHKNLQAPVLYAEECPDEPTIPSLIKDKPLPPPMYEDEEQKISRAVRIITKKVQPSSNFSPKIIKSPKSVNSFSNKQSYKMMEHERQLKSMNKRILNCKNIQQRKKNHNDPLLYPPYFVRESMQAKDVRVDGLYKKVIKDQHKNQQTFHLPSTHSPHTFNPKKQPQSKSHKSTHKPELKKYHYSLNMSNPLLHGFNDNIKIKTNQPPKKNNNNQVHYQYQNPQQVHYSNIVDHQEDNDISVMPTPAFMNKKMNNNQNDKQKNGQSVEYDKKEGFTHPSAHGTFNYFSSDARKREKNGMENFMKNNSHQEEQMKRTIYKNSNYSPVSKAMIPQNDVQAILSYIYDHCLYKANDLDVLRMKMIHYYGKDDVGRNWAVTMKLLHR